MKSNTPTKIQFKTNFNENIQNRQFLVIAHVVVI